MKRSPVDETATLTPQNYEWLTRKYDKGDHRHGVGPCLPPCPGYERLCPDCGANLDPDQEGIVSMGHGEHYEDCDAPQG